MKALFIFLKTAYSLLLATDCLHRTHGNSRNFYFLFFYFLKAEDVLQDDHSSSPQLEMLS